MAQIELIADGGGKGTPGTACRLAAWSEGLAIAGTTMADEAARGVPGALPGPQCAAPLDQIARNRLLPLAPAYEGIGLERVQ